MSTPASTYDLNLPLVAVGKVRELYELSTEHLLFVATDRISAYDVILSNGVPQKGALLTQLSTHWFEILQRAIPELQTHFVSTDLPPESVLKLAKEGQDEARVRRSLEGRCMVVKKLPILPIESIVRGYITGSAWAEYKKKGTMHGMPMPAGLQESQRLEKAVWTPSTKAEQGQHDENISPAQASDILGPDLAAAVSTLSVQLYETAREYAEKRDIIIADTKFEFGVHTDEVTGAKSIVLVDEVLTPDSSRFWDATKYEVGRSQDSLDKQVLRDWLTKEGLKGKNGVAMSEEVFEKTKKAYIQAYERLVGQTWSII